MGTLARPIIALYELSNRILDTSISDLSEADARVRGRDGSGPSVAWTLGHLCHHKLRVLALLGDARVDPFADAFGHTAATDGTGYPPLAELASTFALLHTDVCTALAASADRLEAPLPSEGVHRQERKIIDVVLFLAWHEAYHIGAIGALRKSFGRAAISELVAGRK